MLTIDLQGDLPEMAPGGFSTAPPPPTLPDVAGALRAAAADPRIVGVFLKVGPLSCGWATLQEVKRHMAALRAAGKFSVAYLEVGGEKEYYAAVMCEEARPPPPGRFDLPLAPGCDPDCPLRPARSPPTAAAAPACRRSGSL